MYALHRDASGAVLSAKSWDHDYEFSSWIRDTTFRAGDTIEFGDTVARQEFDEVEPAFLAETPPPPPSVPALAEDEQPF